MNAEKQFKEKGFKREVVFYQKNNLDIIQEIRYVKKTKDEIFEIIFNLLGENKKNVDFRIYTKNGVSIPTVSYEIGKIVSQKKEELLWTQ